MKQTICSVLGVIGSAIASFFGGLGCGTCNPSDLHGS